AGGIDGAGGASVGARDADGSAAHGSYADGAAEAGEATGATAGPYPPTGGRSDRQFEGREQL
ncbi:hypothetical protein ACWD25_54700, partial [Streptomyces sp. NPDC002920]